MIRPEFQAPLQNFDRLLNSIHIDEAVGLQGLDLDHFVPTHDSARIFLIHHRCFSFPQFSNRFNFSAGEGTVGDSFLVAAVADVGLDLGGGRRTRSRWAMVCRLGAYMRLYI